MSKIQVKSLRNKHLAMIDWLLVNPGKSMAVLAEDMGVSRSWVSIVMNSDVFKEEFTKRRNVHTKELGEQLIEKQLKVAIKAYDKLDLILDDEEVEDRTVLDAADKTAKLLNLTPAAGNAPHLLTEDVEIERESVREVAPGVLERARERLRRTSQISFYGNTDALPSPER